MLAGQGGAFESAVIEQIKELGIADKVVMTGFYSPVEELIAAVDVVCLPSQEFDTTPFVVLMSLAIGIPVVITRREDFESVLEDGHSAMLVPVADHRVMAERLQLLALDATVRERLINNGSVAYREHFSFSRMVEDTFSVLRQRAAE